MLSVEWVQLGWMAATILAGSIAGNALEFVRHWHLFERAPTNATCLRISHGKHAMYIFYVSMSYIANS